VTLKLHDLIGTECKLESTCGVLREMVAEFHPVIVGAHHVTCSDETERECAEAFHRWFCGRTLPDLKPAARAAFRTATLGARYERGSVHIAEENFSGPINGGARVVVVKIDSHVAVRDAPGGVAYGRLMRYGRESACCGALAMLMEGSPLPALRELAKVFALDGRDRLGVLRDAQRVPPAQRALLAALTGARLQARRAAADIAEHRPRTPAIFMVVPCVTLNRPGPDTELVVGHYRIDWTGTSAETQYVGLGDDPAAYRVRHERRRVVVEDGQWQVARTELLAGCSGRR
jgi:hypothetical protein